VIAATALWARHPSALQPRAGVARQGGHWADGAEPGM